MKFKKMLSLVMVCILCVALVACGGQTSENGTDSKNKTEKQSAVEKVFVDDENCMFKISGIDPDNMWGYTLKADLENKTDKNLMFSFSDVSVNGYMCDPFWATSVQSGKKAKSDISFMTSELEELGVEEVEEIEFTLTVYDEDDWSAPHLVEETFTYTISK